MQDWQSRGSIFWAIRAGLAIYRRDRREDPQVGAETQPGQVLVEIVDLTTLQARIYVLERDAGNLQVGKEVLIHLDAIPDHVFNGTIKIVSATAQPLERNSPLRYFTCDVQVKDVTEYIRRIRPGMALKADVVIDKYDSCFVLPAGAVTFKDTENLVYVQKGDTFVARQVQTGLSSHGQTTVVEGLKEGETVALKNPFETRQLYLPDFSRAAASQQGGPRGRGGNRGAMMRMFIEQR
jgi:HlyD family secretion protein